MSGRVGGEGEDGFGAESGCAWEMLVRVDGIVG